MTKAKAFARAITVANRFKDYDQEVLSYLPDEEIGKVDMKMSFYAGFIACIGAIKAVSDNLSEEEACDRLSGFVEEIQKFGRDLSQKEKKERWAATILTT